MGENRSKIFWNSNSRKNTLSLWGNIRNYHSMIWDVDIPIVRLESAEVRIQQ